MIAKRVLVTLAAAGLVLAAAAGAAADKDKSKDKGKGKDKATRGHPVYLWADSAFAPGELNRVLLLGFTNTSTTSDAVTWFAPLLEEALRDKPRYAVVDAPQVEREAAAKGAKEDCAALAGQWKAGRSFDPATLERFAKALDARLVMGAEVSEWLSEQIAWNVEGYSHSDVEVKLKLFSAETGALVWEARDKVQQKSAHHDPNAGQAGVVDQLGIQRAQGKVVPAAPPIDDVAKQVAKNLVSALP